MANTFLTPSIIAREALLLLESNMVATMLFSRNHQVEWSGNEKVGNTITIRRRDAAPVVEYNGSTVTPVDITETGISLVLEKHFDCTFKVTSADMTLSLQDFSSQILAPNLIAIAETVDAYALTKLAHLPNVAGPSELTVPAALPTTIAHLAQIERKLNDLKVPMRGRVQIVSPEYKQALLSISNVIQADQSGSTEALREASLGRILGMSSFMDQNVPVATHTIGATQEAMTLNGEHAKGATSLVVASAGNDATYTAGDILNIAGYGGVVVAALATMSAGGAGTITIVEPLRAIVATGTVITPYGLTADNWSLQGAAFHPNAFSLASVPLALPQGAAMADSIQDRGLGLRVVYDYDRNLKSDVISIDCLVGAKMVDGRLGAQILKVVP